eukprot:UC4_evm5s1326
MADSNNAAVDEPVSDTDISDQKNDTAVNEASSDSSRAIDQNASASASKDDDSNTNSSPDDNSIATTIEPLSGKEEAESTHTDEKDGSDSAEKEAENTHTDEKDDSNSAKDEAENINIDQNNESSSIVSEGQESKNPNAESDEKDPVDSSSHQGEQDATNSGAELKNEESSGSGTQGTAEHAVSRKTNENSTLETKGGENAGVTIKCDSNISNEASAANVTSSSVDGGDASLPSAGSDEYVAPVVSVNVEKNENAINQQETAGSQESTPNNVSESLGTPENSNTKSNTTVNSSNPPVDTQDLPKETKVSKDNKANSTIVVKIGGDYMQKKPFLGGFRDAQSGREYLHASAQTYKKLRMERDGCFVDPSTDKVIIPGKYETADQFKNRELEHVLTLQKYLRRWKACKLVAGLQKDRAEFLLWEIKEQKRKEKEKREKQQFDIDRRTNPRTKEDFDLLYTGLEQWRKQMTEQIEQFEDPQGRQQARSNLLEDQAGHIATIERLRKEANEINREKRIQRFLEKTSAPKRWVEPEYGHVNEMQTPYTLRAKELKDLYNSLALPDLSLDERLDVLLNLSWTVKEFDTKLTRNIVELINREADLLLRNTKKKYLTGLRKRILNLFLQFVQTAEFNPEAGRVLQVYETEETSEFKYCKTTEEYLPAEEFTMEATERNQGESKKGKMMKNIATQRQDDRPYRLMLEDCRRCENKLQAGKSQPMFVIQLPEFRYLIDVIWGKQSLLSQVDDISELTLCRWNAEEELSPWNCALLTREEAAAHAKLEDQSSVYGNLFSSKVIQRHLIARSHFSRIRVEESLGKLLLIRRVASFNKSIESFVAPDFFRVLLRSRRLLLILSSAEICTRSKASRITASLIFLSKSLSVLKEQL